MDLTELVDFFVQPGKFKRSGARIPKGVLLCGPPGTGKTLLARAVAGEARVAFLSLNASEFVEMFAGLGASRVRDLFSQVAFCNPSLQFSHRSYVQKRTMPEAILQAVYQQMLARELWSLVFN